MTQRLSPLDATFLFAEHRTATMHVGGVLTFAPPEHGPFDVAGYTALIGGRLGLVPRLRQIVREVPGRLGLPVWVDDDRFDLDHHVRHLALPAPGTDRELRELVDSVMAAPLDRTRPLWEICLVEGLEHGRTAVITKIHHAMADGLSSMELGAALLDPTPQPRETPPDRWRPAAAPSDLALAASATVQTVVTGRALLASALGAVAGADRASVGHAAGAALALARRAAGAPPVAALTAASSGRRRYGTVRTTLADHRAVRRAHGGTVNDVVLAVVAGGLRRWLVGRGEQLTADVSVRAMVPVSLRDRGSAPAGNGISAHLVDLPVGLADPLERLARVRSAMDERKRRGPGAGVALTRLAGVSPPLVHELCARVAGRYSSRLYDVLVTNVPGPPRPLHAMGAPMLDMFPVVPLGGGQAVAVGVASYAGGACYGITAGGDAARDVDVLAGALEESLAELVVRSPARAPRPRVAPAEPLLAGAH